MELWFYVPLPSLQSRPYNFHYFLDDPRQTLARELTGGEGIEIPKLEFFTTAVVPNTCLNYYLFLLYVREMTRFVKS